jgi:alanyl-tRNA synthetase
VAEKDWNASAWIKEISNIIQGGGGGQAFYASAGGKNSNGIPQAINELKKKL